MKVILNTHLSKFAYIMGASLRGILYLFSLVEKFLSNGGNDGRE